MMRKVLYLGTSLILIAAVFAGGCPEPPPEERNEPEHPEEFESPRWFSDSMRWLTDGEKDKVIKIALNTPEASRQQERESIYKTELGWIAIVWENSEPAAWWALDYETVEAGIPAYVPKSAVIYTRVLIHFGEPEKWQVMVAVDLETEEAVLVEENPARGEIAPLDTQTELPK